MGWESYGIYVKRFIPPVISLKIFCRVFPTVQELREVLFGNVRGSFNKEWLQQNLIFSDVSNLEFGLVQHKVRLIEVVTLVWNLSHRR